MNPAEPEIEYRSRLENHDRRLTRVIASYRRLWLYLFGSLSISLFAAYLAFVHLISWNWTILVAMALLPICRLLKTTQRESGRTDKIVEFYKLGTARLSNRWQGMGVDGREFEPESHVYSAGLNIFGKGSVFELLCTARTEVGRSTLAGWLLRPADHDQVLSRQQAVAELRDRLDLREDWASLGAGAVSDVESTTLHNWIRSPKRHFPRYARVLAIALPVCSLALFLLWACKLIPNWQAIMTPVGLGAALTVGLHQRVKSVTESFAGTAFAMVLLVPLLQRFEEEQFDSPLLQRLQARLTDSPIRASRSVATLCRLARLLSWRQSEWFAAYSGFFLWNTNLSMAIESGRLRNGHQLDSWLDALGQFETLLCLSRYCYENPKNTFPELKHNPEALFSAEGLGHPLIDRETCVKTEIWLGAEFSHLLIVSGSNMSGKSTLLRAVGVNAVLALAGAPVRATRLTISCIQVATSIGLQDSLLDGKSRFQTEVERLKWVISLSRAQAVLFLFDEILSGTNSNDRFFGAKAILEELIDLGSVGLVTTHDLSLTKIADDFGDRAINVHFEEHYLDGEMQFDYKMQPGVLTQTNGLNILAAMGLVRADRILLRSPIEPPGT